MVAKVLLVCFASAVLAQAVYGQCACGGSYNTQPSVQVISNQPQFGFNQVQSISNSGSNCANVANSINSANIANSINNANFGNSINSANLANINIGNSIYGNNAGYSVQGQTIAAPGGFSVVSGSPYYDIPSGVSVSSNNNFGGSLAVAGGLPFAGNAYFDGSVASSGQAGLSYSTGNGVSLTGSGCGYGIGGTQYGGQVVSSGIPSVVSSGIYSGVNSGIPNVVSSGINIGSGYNYGGASTCGCI